MNRPARYNTKQQKAILDYLISLKGEHVMIGQIVNHFKRSEKPIGMATIYRHLDRLLRDGVILKYTVDNLAGACYQLKDSGECTSHFHLKCEGCGSVVHFTCDVLEQMGQHVKEEHGLTVDPHKTVFYGRCAGCAIKERE